MDMIWLALSVLAWGFLHSLFASLGFKEVVRRRFGRWVDRYYRLIYNLFASLSFGLILVLAVLTPDRTLYSVPMPWLIPLVIGQGLAVVALVVGFLQSHPMAFLGIRQLGPKLEESQPLTIAGLYHYVRHPLYTAGLAFIWLIPLMTERLLAINLALTVYVIVGAFLEERKLVREYGQEYLRYISNTPMFIPFLKGNKPAHNSSQ